jgi:hypothetical protein
MTFPYLCITSENENNKFGRESKIFHIMGKNIRLKERIFLDGNQTRWFKSGREA